MWLAHVLHTYIYILPSITHNLFYFKKKRNVLVKLVIETTHIMYLTIVTQTKATVNKF